MDSHKRSENKQAWENFTESLALKKIRLKSKNRSSSHAHKAHEKKHLLPKKKKDKKVNKEGRPEEKKPFKGITYTRKKKKSNNDPLKPSQNHRDKIRRLLSFTDSRHKFKFEGSNLKNHIRKYRPAERKEKGKEGPPKKKID